MTITIYPALQRIQEEVQIKFSKEVKIWTGPCGMDEIILLGDEMQKKGESWKNKPLWCESLFSCKEILQVPVWYQKQTIHTKINKTKNIWTQRYPLKVSTLQPKCPNWNKVLKKMNKRIKAETWNITQVYKKWKLFTV